jgi:hypothetical protein
LECAPAWEGNWTSDCFIAFAWEGPDEKQLLVVVNYADNQSQCYVRLPFSSLGGRTWRLHDRLGKSAYERDGDSLQSQGLFLDLSRWAFHVFDVTVVKYQTRPARLTPVRSNPLIWDILRRQ